VGEFVRTALANSPTIDRATTTAQVGRADSNPRCPSGHSDFQILDGVMAKKTTAIDHSAILSRGLS